ncbi:MAG TPA: AmmeMemoRadiSam system protein B [Phycisphaerae bacterium]|nr:AmmeMemoRadiSam system protein B [Phycisphaerae bacterium]
MFAQDRAGSVRPPVCAGTWYPGDRAELAKEVDSLMDKAPPAKVEGKPVAVIAPHAGYRYSAPVAAAGYRCLRGQTYKRVMVMAFSHSEAGSYTGVDVPRDLTAYATPLGQVPIDREVCDDLLKKRVFVSQPGVGGSEHSLELQLPFLQETVKDFKLVPMLVGRMSDRDYAQASEAIVRWVDDDTLIVASSDCTHFGPNYGYEPFRDDVPTRLRELADAASAAIQKCDFDGFTAHLTKTRDTICGRGPISLLLRILSMQGGAEGVRAAFDTSGNITGDWRNSVTYQSFVFTRRPGKLNEQERAELLRIARATVKEQLSGKKPPDLDADKLPAAIKANGACFVTLENQGDLRGCIGNMVADGPLYKAVIHNAVLACQDPRFVTNPVTMKELDQLHIEISYLTPMQRVKDISEIIIGRHGLLISQGFQRGVLLPQVAYERGWTREEFLTQTCHKAGLPPDAWKSPQSEISSFEAEVFGEKK